MPMPLAIAKAIASKANNKKQKPAKKKGKR
jgi:hypothetical protein